MSLLKLVAAYGFLFSVIVIALYALVIVGRWMIFKKAAQAGWKSLIPIYSTYTLYKYCWSASWFWITLALAFVGGLLASVSATLGSLLISVASVINFIALNYKVSKAFGHGIGYTIGLALFPSLFTMILGLGSSTYRHI